MRTKPTEDRRQVQLICHNIHLPFVTMSQSLAALMLSAGVSRVFTAAAVFFETFPRLAAEVTPRSTYARPLSKFSCGK